MQVDEKLISYLEDLSYLTLSDDEKSRLESDLNKIIKGMEKLNELDTSGVPERSHSFDVVNSFREDEIEPSFDRELILQNAPRRSDNMFSAPHTIHN